MVEGQSPKVPVVAAVAAATSAAAVITLKESASEGKSHAGIAVPVSMEEIEREMAEIKGQSSSTSKDGISTWILLSGTQPTANPIKSKATTAASVDKPNTKADKIVKVAAAAAKPPQRVPAISKAEIMKNKNKKLSTTTTTEATMDAVTTKTPAAKVQQKKKPAHEMLPEPVAVQSATSMVKSKPTATVHNSVISVSSTEDAEDRLDDEMELIATSPPSIPEKIKKEPATPFLVLEPKDADFDLPQDRSPGKTKKTTKRPAAAKPANKKKTPNKKKDEDDLKNGTKVALKPKDKPMSTVIYNYLSREIMPTVGVGLIGLVVTAGLAGYLLGPLGALRRSYEVADRKDDLYYYNNEEYAGPGSDGGQSEEEVFGKVIAGMPVVAQAQSNYRNNVRYVQQQQQQQQLHRPYAQHPKYAQGPHHPHHHQQQQQFSRYRNAGGPKPQQQRPVYSQSPPSANGQRPVNFIQQRNHLASNVMTQKSISNQIFALPSAAGPVEQPPATTTPTTTTAATTTTTTTTTTTEEPQPQMVNIVYSSKISADPISDRDGEETVDENNDMSNELLKRRSQFVVGTVFDEPNELTQDDGAVVQTSVPEHGPRRRRRRSIQLPAPTPISSSTKAELNEAYEKVKARLKEKIANGTEKNEPIKKELNLISRQMTRLDRDLAEVKQIDEYQSALRQKATKTISTSVAQITASIAFVNDLLDSPKDVVAEKIAKRDMTLAANQGKTIADKMDTENEIDDVVEKEKEAVDTTTVQPTFRPMLLSDSEIEATTTSRKEQEVTEKPSRLNDWVNLIKFKAALAVKLLRSIRPTFTDAFNRALEEVYPGDASMHAFQSKS